MSFPFFFFCFFNPLSQSGFFFFLTSLQKEKKISHHFIQVQPFYIRSGSLSCMTLSSTNLSCGVKRQKGTFKRSVSAVIKRKAATSPRRQLWSTAALDQRDDTYSYFPNIFFFSFFLYFFCINHRQMRPEHMSPFHFKRARAEFKGLCLCLCN